MESPGATISGEAATSLPAPTDPIAAVVHPDPYPYYRSLAARGPIRYDQRLGLWFVTGHAAIAEVLVSPAIRIRPVAEPVPTALVGTITGDVFARLVRMTDGRRSQATRRALETAVALVPPERSSHLADVTAERVFAAAAQSGEPDWPIRALLALPVMAMGSLLGLTGSMLDELTERVSRFADAIAPAPFTGDLAAGELATRELVAQVDALLDQPAGDTPGLLGEFVRQAESTGMTDRDTIIANAIGVLFQSLAATAGLIGNTLRALATHPARSVVAADPASLDRILDETARYDPPVQNTRRVAAETTSIAGQVIPPGATLLLLLATANRDPDICPEPDHFDPNRTGDRSLTFGAGPHHCPCQRLARTIALAGVRHGIRHGLASASVKPPRFVPSPNTRISILSAPNAGSASPTTYLRRTP